MREENYWRQRYEMLMANFGDAVRAAGLPRPPIMLAEQASYEAGRIAGIEQCKSWFGLTDEEFIELCSADLGTAALIRAVEAKLKEKNYARPD